MFASKAGLRGRTVAKVYAGALARNVTVAATKLAHAPVPPAMKVATATTAPTAALTATPRRDICVMTLKSVTVGGGIRIPAGALLCVNQDSRGSNGDDDGNSSRGDRAARTAAGILIGAGLTMFTALAAGHDDYEEDEDEDYDYSQYENDDDFDDGDGFNGLDQATIDAFVARARADAAKYGDRFPDPAGAEEDEDEDLELTDVEREALDALASGASPHEVQARMRAMRDAMSDEERARFDAEASAAMISLDTALGPHAATAWVPDNTEPVTGVEYPQHADLFLQADGAIPEPHRLVGVGLRAMGGMSFLRLARAYTMGLYVPEGVFEALYLADAPPADCTWGSVEDALARTSLFAKTLRVVLLQPSKGLHLGHGFVKSFGSRLAEINARLRQRAEEKKKAAEAAAAAAAEATAAADAKNGGAAGAAAEDSDCGSCDGLPGMTAAFDLLLDAQAEESEEHAERALSALKDVVEHLQNYNRGDELVLTWTPRNTLLVTLPAGCTYKPAEGKDAVEAAAPASKRVTVADWQQANRVSASESSALSAEDKLAKDADTDLVKAQYPAPSLAQEDVPPPAVEIASPRLAQAVFLAYLGQGTAVSGSAQSRIADMWRKLTGGRVARGEPALNVNRDEYFVAKERQMEWIARGNDPRDLKGMWEDMVRSAVRFRVNALKQKLAKVAEAREGVKSAFAAKKKAAKPSRAAMEAAIVEDVNALLARDHERDKTARIAALRAQHAARRAKTSWGSWLLYSVSLPSAEAELRAAEETALAAVYAEPPPTMPDILPSGLSLSALPDDVRAEVARAHEFIGRHRDGTFEAKLRADMRRAKKEKKAQEEAAAAGVSVEAPAAAEVTTATTKAQAVAVEAPAAAAVDATPAATAVVEPELPALAALTTEPAAPAQKTEEEEGGFAGMMARLKAVMSGKDDGIDKSGRSTSAKTGGDMFDRLLKSFGGGKDKEETPLPAAAVTAPAEAPTTTVQAELLHTVLPKLSGDNVDDVILSVARDGDKYAGEDLVALSQPEPKKPRSLDGVSPTDLNARVKSHLDEILEHNGLDAAEVAAELPVFDKTEEGIVNALEAHKAKTGVAPQRLLQLYLNGEAELPDEMNRVIMEDITGGTNGISKGGVHRAMTLSQEQRLQRGLKPLRHVRSPADAMTEGSERIAHNASLLKDAYKQKEVEAQERHAQRGRELEQRREQRIANRAGVKPTREELAERERMLRNHADAQVQNEALYGGRSQAEQLAQLQRVRERDVARRERQYEQTRAAYYGQNHTHDAQARAERQLRARDAYNDYIEEMQARGRDAPIAGSARMQRLTAENEGRRGFVADAPGYRAQQEAQRLYREGQAAGGAMDAYHQRRREDEVAYRQARNNGYAGGYGGGYDDGYGADQRRAQYQPRQYQPQPRRLEPGYANNGGYGGPRGGYGGPQHGGDYDEDGDAFGYNFDDEDDY